MNSTEQPRPEAGGAPGPWQAFHVFYAASPRPMLLDCVTPLVGGLREDGLLAGWFFINYWLEGPHIRLRLRPSASAAAEPVRQRAEAAISEFLRRRPALYEVKEGFFAELYNTLFELEFPAGGRDRLLGPDGRMRLRENNSFSREPYEPEYGKYGGPAGVALAEWHFERSSELVMEAARTMNLHVRTVVLGLAAQLMMVMGAAMVPGEADLLRFLDRYHAFWNTAFEGTNFTARNGYDRAYSAMSAELPRRFGQIRHSVAGGRPEHLPAVLRGWAAHCLELRERVVELTCRGGLVFRAMDGTRDLAVDDPAHSLPMLLSPYMHMTNNRLGVTVRDEAYLSYVLARALREPAAAEVS